MQLGGVTDTQAEQDIKDAAALGVDAFAVNLRMSPHRIYLTPANSYPENIHDSWATNAITYLFKHASSHNFKLLYVLQSIFILPTILTTSSFSFDMTAFDSPDDFITLLKSYITNDAYYTYEGQPFVSTFNVYTPF